MKLPALGHRTRIRLDRAVAVVPVLLLPSGCGGATPSAAPPETQHATRAVDASARCAVWDREISFATSVKNHDAGAFAEHVHPEAMFVDGEKDALRGRDTIARAWSSVVRGEPVKLAWHPTSVVVAPHAATAVSRGPYVITDLRAGAESPYKRGIFQSVWVRDTDGAWRILIDGGTAAPVPITKDEADKFDAELRAPCDPAADALHASASAAHQ